LRAGSRRPDSVDLTALARRPWTPPAILAHGDGSAVHLLGLDGPDAGRERELGTHSAQVRELAVAPDGTRVASIDENGGLRVWRSRGMAVRTLDAQAPTAISALAFDASGSRLGGVGRRRGLGVSLDDPPDAAPGSCWRP